MRVLVIVSIISCLVATVTAFFRGSVNAPSIARVQAPIETALFAHHPQKKIIKKKMHNRPKKLRPSDIHRNNVNFGKCITKVADAPPEYEIIKPEDFERVNAEVQKFLEFGDSTEPWIEFIPEDNLIFFPQKIETPPEGVPKVVVPPLVRSRSLA